MLPAPHLNEYLKRFLPPAGMKPADVLKATRTPYLTLVVNPEDPPIMQDDVKAVQLLDEEDGPG